MKLVILISILFVFTLSEQETLSEKVVYSPISKQVGSNTFQNTMSSSQEILYGLNPYGPDFPFHTKELIENLCIELDLDYSFYENDLLELVKTLDQRIRSKRDSSFYKDKFINIIALIGEAVNQKKGTSWIMLLSENDKVTWNIYLTISDEKIIFYTYLYEDIFLSDGDNEYIVEDIHQTVLDIININISKR